MSRIAQAIIERGHGMIACGDGLGVMVAPAEHIKSCPPGWVFVDSETATVGIVDEAIQAASSGRKNWPSKE